MQLAGKTILLTGGTDGIGLALATQLRASGATLILGGRNPDRVAAAQAQGYEVLAADLCSVAGVESLIAQLGDRPIDILINNAGISGDFFIDNPEDLASVDAKLFCNVHAPVHLIVHLIDRLRARPEAMIVNVTSGLAIAPRGDSPLYCASKAALRSFTMALRYQLRDTRVHVLEVLPPLVATKMTHRYNDQRKRMSPEACAAEIVRAMQSNAREANVGMVKLLRLVYGLSPALARRVMLSF